MLTGKHDRIQAVISGYTTEREIIDAPLLEEPERLSRYVMTTEEPGRPPTTRAERRIATTEARARRRRRRFVTGGAIVVTLAAAVTVTIVASSGEDSRRDQSSRPSSTVVSSTTSSQPASGDTPTTAVPRSDDPLVAAVQQYDGRYTGTWESARNGATGPASMELRVDPATKVIQVDADFDGDLFGNQTAPVRHISAALPLSLATAVPVATEAFGEVSGRLDPPFGVVLEASSVPDEGVDTFTLVGQVRADGTALDVTFTVTYADGSAADGIVTVGCDPSGNRPSDVPTLCAPA